MTVTDIRTNKTKGFFDLGSRYLGREECTKIPSSVFEPWEREKKFEKKPHKFFPIDMTPIFDDCLNYFMDAVNCVLVDRMHLSDATRWLKDLLDGDAGFADNLSDDAVEILLQIFDNDKSVVWKYIDDDIQSLAIHILSHALSREKFHMLEQNALGEVQKIASIKPRDSELVEWVTKFLAVICYRGLPQEKVKEALTISERLLQINSLGDRNIGSTCYALQYLTYGKHVPIEGKAWEKLIKRLRAYISSCFTFNDTAAACFEPIRSEYIVVSGSALGVVGNFARWGNLYQIQESDCNNSKVCNIFRLQANTFRRIVALFSSRGPSYLSHNLLKPDITAPGVNIIAAWSKMNTEFALPGQAPPDYVVISGTSMATPHIAVVDALTNIGCSSEF
ncbi:hypothetical protein POM88_001241 [Heracleum sosnowskyi]|uniref:Peptidase S8/S53 domain-containing protein n=1 Tax=Heracleum sosnowskyi TaxID=360622 RepID=A0AAD8JFF8_9APIA|nr:hypothetical protein POM88_001241 [Heracleum sosnowskyi]